MTAGLDEIPREATRRMRAAALAAEADMYIESLADERGRRGQLVVSNGQAEPRTVTLSNSHHADRDVEAARPRFDTRIQLFRRQRSSD
jgi:hypothetical protein